MENNNFIKSKITSTHGHLHHSKLDGLSNEKEAAQRYKELGYGAASITDHGTLSGTYAWYKACNEVGIKPILGCEFYMAINDYKIHDNSEKERTHLTVLAKNKKGWQNLCRLNYLSYKDGFYYKNRIDYKLLFEHKEGLIVLSGCASSQISKYIKNDEFDKAKDLIIKLKEEFKDDFYLELQSHDWEPQKKINKFLRQASKELDIKTLVGADSHYVNHSDQYEHEIVLCIGTASNINDKDRMTLKDFDLSIPDPKDLEKEFSLELENSKEIYDKCNFDFKELFDGHVILPDFTDKDKEYDLLRRLVFEGYKKKYTGNETWKGETIQQRIHRELETIKKMDYVGYLLIVSDICRWCKKNDILVGPGRGSVGGSVVAYCLDITSFSPLIEDIVFERFVNEDRYSPCDIDLDFQEDKRHLVIEYITKRYGEEFVSGIGIYSKLKAKSAFKDVARTLGMSFEDSLKATKEIYENPLNVDKYLMVSLKGDGDKILPSQYVVEQYNNNPLFKEVFDEAVKLEGKLRQIGTHACGKLISPINLTWNIPLMVSNGDVITQWDHPTIESLVGVQKFDILGLSNLKIAKNTIKNIRFNL